MNRIGIITYQYPHLKTEQLLLSLLRRKVPPEQLQVFALPFQPRKRREVLFPHRPDQMDAVSPDILCKAAGIPYRECACDREIPDSCDRYLIGGSGILSPETVRNKRILNAHPGIIPAARGLDAFKWSIYYSLPLGVTLHYIDQQVDGGEIVSVVPTPVFITDSLATLARRHYENEIAVLSAFREHLADPQNHFPSPEPREAARRMPLQEESVMLRSFEKYKEKYSFPYLFIRVVVVGCALFSYVFWTKFNGNISENSAEPTIRLL